MAALNTGFFDCAKCVALINLKQNGDLCVFVFADAAAPRSLVVMHQVVSTVRDHWRYLRVCVCAFMYVCMCVCIVCMYIQYVCMCI